MRKFSLPTILPLLLAATLLCACHPKYDWRDYRSQDAPFVVLFPDKPASYTRNVELDGLTVKMTMVAAQIEGTMFAVGSAEVPDAKLAPAALAAMKTALVRNIGGTVTTEKSSTAASASGSKSTLDSAIDVQASGAQGGVPMQLIGHFVAHDKRIYQVIVMGKQKAIVRDQVDMFMSSFKLN